MVGTPDDIEALKAALAAERAARLAAEARVSSIDALVASLKLQIEKLRRELYGQRSERKARLLDQMELELEELEASATEDELEAEMAAAETTEVKAFTRRKPSKKPFPEHLPRERVVIPGPTSCDGCGSDKLAKLGEDVTGTLEVIPRQWKVIQYVREEFTCRHCGSISQPPAPFHVIPRGFAGPSLLAMILFEKYGVHQPLNRQSERYAREGVDLSLSTLADLVGACTVVLRPLVDLIEAHVLKADRLHADVPVCRGEAPKIRHGGPDLRPSRPAGGDDTPIRVLARGQCKKATAWAHVRDDRPFGGPDPPAVLFHYSRNRKGEHPTRHLADFAGVLQADAYSGFNPLLDPGREPGPITPALCWAHRSRSAAASRRRSGLPCPTFGAALLQAGQPQEIFRARRPQEAGSKQKTAPDLAHGAGGGQADRRPVRHRARDQWPVRRGAVEDQKGKERALDDRTRGLDA